MSKIKTLRENKSLKQEEMANLLNISAANYCKKEKGQLRFSLEEAKKLANYFNLSIEAIFFDDEVSKIDTLQTNDNT